MSISLTEEVMTLFSYSTPGSSPIEYNKLQHIKIMASDNPIKIKRHKVNPFDGRISRNCFFCNKKIDFSTKKTWPTITYHWRDFVHPAASGVYFCAPGCTKLFCLAYAEFLMKR